MVEKFIIFFFVKYNSKLRQVLFFIYNMNVFYLYSTLNIWFTDKLDYVYRFTCKRNLLFALPKKSLQTKQKNIRHNVELATGAPTGEADARDNHSRAATCPL